MSYFSQKHIKKHFLEKTVGDGTSVEQELKYSETDNMMRG